MKIVIITAMPVESKAVMGRAKPRKTSLPGGRKRYCARIGGHDIVLVEAGMGMFNADWAATALTGEAPDLMLSAGFGGAVLDGLVVGDVVLAEQVMRWSDSGLEEVAVEFHGSRFDTDRPLIRRGVYITCNMILNKHALSHLLPANAVNPVVEMESAAVAMVATTHNIPFLGLRAISDPWDEELAFSVSEFCGDDMRIRPIKVLTTVLKQPSIIPQLIRLARNSRIAAASLTLAMERLLHQLL